MKRQPQASTPLPQQPQRDTDVPFSLANCPDVLTVTDLCRLLQIGRSYYYSLVKHHRFPIQPLRTLPGVVRYSKVSVQRWLETNGKHQLSRTA